MNLNKVLQGKERALQKAKALPIGTIKEWQSGKYKKTSKGWVPMSSGKSKGKSKSEYADGGNEDVKGPFVNGVNSEGFYSSGTPALTQYKANRGIMMHKRKYHIMGLGAKEEGREAKTLKEAIIKRDNIELKLINEMDSNSKKRAMRNRATRKV